MNAFKPTNTTLSPKPVVRCQNLGKNFTSQGNTIDVIKNLSLEIYEGEFTVLMGGSGSGKSTLLYLLSGLEQATSGSIYFEATDLSTLSEQSQALLRRKGMGFVFQSFNLVPNLSILENILIAGYLTDTDKATVEANAERLLDNMDLLTLANRLPTQISGGQQQRASIARSLINAPTILFADEPTGALNSSAGKMVLDHFSMLAEQGQTIFMVTHELRAACRADRVLYMKDGALHGDYRFSAKEEALAAREAALFDWLTHRGW